VAVLYVSLDGGLDIGLLGVSRMQLPESDVALVSIELALKARFSTVEMLLSIQAQLTDNSWLLSEDCKLTGGFAFVIWFRDHQFVVTLGGYHPAFQRPDKFPVVPRLGFHWSISDFLTIKGESYFALTSSAVMAGGRLEATFDADIVRAWFIAHADFLISWDPFYYGIGIGISVGASFQITISIFGADITISLTISLGADLELEGPPLHGTVTVELEICSVTIAFGPQASKKVYIADWGTFATKYL